MLILSLAAQQESDDDQEKSQIAPRPQFKIDTNCGYGCESQNIPDLSQSLTLEKLEELLDFELKYDFMLTLFNFYHRYPPKTGLN